MLFLLHLVILLLQSSQFDPDWRRRRAVEALVGLHCNPQIGEHNIGAKYKNISRRITILELSNASIYFNSTVSVTVRRSEGDQAGQLKGGANQIHSIIFSVVAQQTPNGKITFDFIEREKHNKTLSGWHSPQSSNSSSPANYNLTYFYSFNHEQSCSPYHDSNYHIPQLQRLKAIAGISLARAPPAPWMSGGQSKYQNGRVIQPWYFATLLLNHNHAIDQLSYTKQQRLWLIHLAPGSKLSI